MSVLKHLTTASRVGCSDGEVRHGAFGVLRISGATVKWATGSADLRYNAGLDV
jgi:hypothetical protein